MSFGCCELTERCQRSHDATLSYLLPPRLTTDARSGECFADGSNLVSTDGLLGGAGAAAGFFGWAKVEKCVSHRYRVRDSNLEQLTSRPITSRSGIDQPAFLIFPAVRASVRSERNGLSPSPWWSSQTVSHGAIARGLQAASDLYCACPCRYPASSLRAYGTAAALG